jgi:multimeric flavodoxin WrbA
VKQVKGNRQLKRKIMIIQGSPRKNGNTATLSKAVAAEAEKNGAQVESVFLSNLNINPCNACDHCQKDNSDGCILKDDMTALYPKLEEADSIVFATPVYWFNMTAQIKTFIDRLYAVGVEEKNIFKDKEMAALLCYADNDPFDSGAVNALRSFQDIFNYLGAVNAGMVYGSAGEPGDIRKDKEVMNKAAALGEKLSLLK